MADPEFKGVPSTDGDPAVPAGAQEHVNVQRGIESEPHDCWDHPVPMSFTRIDGTPGHGWECGKCGAFLHTG